MRTPGRSRLASSAAASITGTAQALLDTPWWLTAMACGCFALDLAVDAIQSVFPQESQHRLDWWRDRWHDQRLRWQSRRRPNRTRARGTAEEVAPRSGPHNGSE